MEVVLEQFIPSDGSKTISNMLKNVAILFGIVALMSIFNSIIVGIVLAIIASAFFLGSYLIYVDYEYELYNGDITITKVYNASRRKIVQKINRAEVLSVRCVERKDNIKNKGVNTYYNTNLEGLHIYTFELNSRKVVQLALNAELEKIVKIVYVQKMSY